MPYQLTSNMKTTGLEGHQRLPVHDKSDSDDYRIVTGGKSWVHYYNPESRSQSPNIVTPLLSERKKYSRLYLLLENACSPLPMTKEVSFIRSTWSKVLKSTLRLL